MSVPDNSRPKAPPSLLADAPARPAGAPASGAPNGSRILANLEGRVVPPVPPAGKTQRSSKAAGLVALLVIGAGAFGAWHWMSRTSPGASNAPSVAAAAASAAAVASASAVPASHAIVAGASKPDEASAPHAATIVADDDTANEKPGDGDRLSRALADGSASGAAAPAAPVAPQAKAVQPVQTPEKSTAKHKSAADAKQEKQEKANAHKSESKTAVAQSKTAHANGKRDDSDVDLLAVLVARTKPADAKQGGSTHGSKTAARSADANASLAQQVKACSERGFFEDQLCRWRVCDGHWGKDPSCPQAAKASSEH